MVLWKLQIKVEKNLSSKFVKLALKGNGDADICKMDNSTLQKLRSFPAKWSETVTMLF
jgi:hypothetical protein